MFVGAVDDQNFRALLHEAEDSRTCGPTCSEDSNASTFEPEATFERTDDPGYIGVESIKLSIRTHAEGIAGTDARGERVHISEVRQHLGFERHGDSAPRQRQLQREGE